MQEATSVDHSDRTATGADRTDVDPSRLNRHTDDCTFIGDLRPAIDDQCRIEARAADIGDDEIAKIAAAGQFARTLGACHGSRHDGFEWPDSSFREVHRTAARARYQRHARKAQRRQIDLQVIEITHYLFAHISVDHRRAGSLELPVFS